MGLTASIYKSGVDCSNGGISSYANEVCLVNVDGPFVPRGDIPAAMLMPGAYPGIVRAVPAEQKRLCVNCGCEQDERAEPLCNVDGLVSGHSFQDRWVEMRNGIGPMMGGCYVSTSDSRFVEAVEALTGARFYGAVALHDRYETPKQYASYD